MTLMEGVRVLPLDTMDLDTQHCRMGPSLMIRLKLRLGSPVLIRVHQGTCLCTAWPRQDLIEGYLQFSTQCATPVLSTKTLNGLMVDSAQIKPLTCPKLTCLRGKVFVQSLEYKRDVSERSIQELLKELLNGLYVHEGHLVELSHAKTEIRFVLVEKVNSGSHTAGLVTGKTHVDISVVQTVKHYQSQQQMLLLTLGGVEDVCASLKEIITFPLRYPQALGQLGLSCPRGVLLIGPPGVGKTLLVRYMAKDIGATLVTVNGPEVIGSRPGESEENLRRMFDQARDAAEEGPCILLIDEIDSLCPRRTGSSSAPENRLVAQLLTLMDAIGSDEGFVIIGATNQPDTLDPALRRPGRFDREVIMGVPSLLQRRSILQCVCREMPLSPDVDLSAVAEMTCGYVGADLSALSREAALQAMQHSQEGACECVEMQHFTGALRQVQPSCLRSSIGATDFKPINWEQIGGLEEVKLKLKQSIEWPMKFPEAFMRLGISRPKGVLLYGPPGCAKTKLVKAAASSSHCTFLSLSGAELFSPYVGDSEKTLAQLFVQARACAPSIVFLDEIDSMVGSRADSGSSHSVQSQVLSVLLTELDGVGFRTLERRSSRKVVQFEGGKQEETRLHQMELQELCNKDVLIVAATNRPDVLDSALLRPGRLDQIIYVPPPDIEGRLAVLRICTERIPLHQDVCLQDLAARTDLFSGADLENLCKEAALLALREDGFSVSCVEQKYFLRALQSLTPSLSPEQLKQNIHSTLY
ncbi:spermatogenesis-associated protein 5-like protein 1 [Myxocyprinus asiaticus]|uniref:spermatogenesis-associated protein 5-like protein 1 n=1 Tax=Myxocyprinus asiaticus TaxID=70543 RepID=UPI00222214AC|nr:spermatogenesis-associated protein 5-like protein 1 [Myxocyprinus asiaticus]XP_051580789.1 spermatogenesis-associated protein 5-like protein 1 [Myxocyprinus asiaticus]XP_051580790.1 spermatogenesis-associated protein 5-like protein 1 [Myxocyprinus asiaticus]